MDYQRRGLSWPFLGMLVCLFALSITAPRSWERLARPRAISKLQRAPVPTPIVAAFSQPAPPIDKTPTAINPPPMQFVGPRLRPAPDAVQGPAADPRLAELYGAFEELVAADAIGARVRPSIDDPVTGKGPELRLAARPGQLKMGPQSADDFDTSLLPRTSPVVYQDQPEWLYGQLERLSHDPGCAMWAWRTAALVRNAHQPAARDNPALRETLFGHLALATQEAGWLAREMEGDRAIAVRRVRHALVRRLDIWRLAAAVDRQADTAIVFAEPQPGLSRAVAEVAALTADSPSGNSWQQYLMLDALRSVALQPTTADAHVLAQQILDRLDRRHLDLAQRRFAADGPLAALTQSLRRIAAEPLEMDEILSRLERFERCGSVREGQLIAEQLRNLGQSPHGEARQLAERIELHYRNCNLRVAVSQDLLSRLLPAQNAVQEPVRDSILGVPVRGQSETLTTLRIRTIPHNSRLLLALEAHGAITASTVSQSGPATLFNDAWSDYVVRKPIEVTLDGLRVFPAQSSAQSRTRLRNFETDFDGIPLLGSLVRNVVEKRVAEGAPAAQREIQRKVESKALRHMDAEADERLTTADKKFEDQVFSRLTSLSLNPTLAALQSTDSRAILRVRLATGHQLAAHTPRPRAPSDSVLSLQLHESALNNVISQLELDGRGFNVPELHQWIATKLQLPEPNLDDLRHEDANIRFADHDAVQVLCRDDRVQVTLSLAEVGSGYNRWSNFSVRVFYRPESSGLHGELVRDGTIQLIGYGLGAKGQVALRGIFSRMFSKERRLPLMPERLADDPRLDEFEVTQFVIDDGWIGLALGPRRSDRHLPVAWTK